MSALEDLINKFENDDGGLEVSPIRASPQASQTASRLENELRRLTSQDEDLSCDNDYSAMPNAVKRTILGWYIEESPRVVKGGLRPAAPDELPNSAKMAIQQGQQPGTSGAAAMSRLASGASTSAASTREQELRELAISMGYTIEEVERVFNSHGMQLKDSDFMQLLVSQRSPLANSNAAASHQGAAAATPEHKTPHPLEQIIETHSPGLLGHHTSAASTTGVNGGPLQEIGLVSYLQQLSKDFAEEEGDGQDLQTYRKNNAERLRLIKVAIEQKKEGRKVQEVEVIQINDDSDIDETPAVRPQTGSKEAHSGEKSSTVANKRTGNKKNRHSPQHRKGARGKSPQNRKASPQRFNPVGLPQGQNRQASPHRQPHQSPARKQRPSVCEQSGPPHRQFPQHISPVRPPPQKNAAENSNKRYIVIDGSNVAMQ